MTDRKELMIAFQAVSKSLIEAGHTDPSNIATATRWVEAMSTEVNRITEMRSGTAGGGGNHRAKPPSVTSTPAAPTSSDAQYEVQHSMPKKDKNGKPYTAICLSSYGQADAEDMWVSFFEIEDQGVATKVTRGDVVHATINRTGQWLNGQNLRVANPADVFSSPTPKHPDIPF